MSKRTIELTEAKVAQVEVAYAAYYRVATDERTSVAWSGSVTYETFSDAFRTVAQKVLGIPRRSPQMERLMGHLQDNFDGADCMGALPRVLDYMGYRVTGVEVR